MDPGDLRVSDHERELVGAALRTHFAAGRLDADELDGRLSAAYGARIRRELVIAMLIPLLKGSWDLYSPWGDLDRLEAELDEKANKRMGNHAGSDDLPTLGSSEAGDRKAAGP